MSIHTYTHLFLSIYLRMYTGGTPDRDVDMYTYGCTNLFTFVNSAPRLLSSSACISLSLYIYIYTYIYIYVSIHTYTYLYLYFYLCMYTDR